MGAKVVRDLALDLKNGEGMKVVHLLAIITSALATIVMAFGLFIITGMDSKIDGAISKIEKTNDLLVAHMTGPPHAGVAGRLDLLAKAVR